MGLTPSLRIEKGSIGSEVPNITDAYTTHSFSKDNCDVVFSEVKWWTKHKCDLVGVEFWGW